MRRFQHIILTIILLIVAIFTLTFILENQTKVSISFITFETPPLSLAVLIVIAFVIGLMLALVISSLILLKVKLRLSITRKKLESCKKELAKQNLTQ